MDLILVDNFDDNVPLGVNGIDSSFNLPNTPRPPLCLEVVRNGKCLVQGTDYTLVGTTVTFPAAPAPTDIVTATYRY